jgi:hypothetical protein
VHRQSPTPAAGVAARDLAVSAVASDAGLVAELIADISSRLQTAPAWHPTPSENVDAAAVEVPFAATTSRVVLVLFHHLWLHDPIVQRDLPLLRERLAAEPGSVCVLSLDRTPLPAWLRGADRYDLLRKGREGAAAFVVDAVARAGGLVGELSRQAVPDEAPVRWPEPPAPFLSQQRALSALRHELDSLAAALEAAIDEAQVAQPDRTFDLQVSPQRMVARLDDVAVSFSWLAGRTPSVAEGNLLVIGWQGVTPGPRGITSLRTAAVMHEQSYVADGDAPSSWRWRSVDAVAHPYSSASLVAEWMARASIVRAGCVSVDEPIA